MQDYDYYVAGPFFNAEQLSSMQALEQVLDRHRLRLFKPRFVSDIAISGPQQCFEDDCAGIRASRCLIANLIDDDPGTMFEIGYAYALGKPVLGFKAGCKQDDPVNLMIAESATEVFVSIADLDEYLSTGTHQGIRLREY